MSLRSGVSLLKQPFPLLYFAAVLDDASSAWISQKLEVYLLNL
jgi:hypothetical protein